MERLVDMKSVAIALPLGANNWQLAFGANSTSIGAMYNIAAIVCLVLLGISLAVAQNPTKPATKPKPESFTTGSSPALDSGTTPRIGSPEWKKEQADSERKEQRLKSIINSICRGC